jgi:type II secretion system protein D
VERLIEHLDESPAASAVIKVFEIANGNASDLVIVLRTLFPVTAVGSGVPALATAEGETSLVPVRFSVDARTNTIIATGTSSDLQVMEALLIRLDEVASQERVNEVYHLRNTPATAVAQAVNDFLQSERIVNQAAPGRQNPFEQIQQEVVVVPEIVRNQLIISATPRFFDQIMELVENLDSKPPQVLIQVILAEVLLDNFHELGVELGIQDSLLFDRSLLGDLVQTTVSNALSTPAGVVTTTQQQIVSASNTPGFNFNNNTPGNSGSTQSLGTAGNVGGQGLSSFTVGRTNSELGYGGLVLSASSENVSLLLRALDRTGSVEILSRPQIMTLDNQEAFIQVGQSVPRIASSSVTQFGQVNTVEDTEVGLLLGVIPRINPDGTVVMQVDATKSEVGPEAQGIPIFVSTEGTVVRSPRVNITSAQTTVSASSGQTIVIGGLITTNNTTEHRKVPWLGDLPALGKLFRYDSYANRRTELLIILTPHVVLGRGDADYLKQIEMSRMSWVSSDVFELIGPGSHVHRLGNDSGVEVIYPDATPGLQGSVPAIPPALDSGPNAIDPVPMDSSLIPNNELNPVGSRDEFSIEGAPEGFSTELDQVIYRKPTSDSDSSRTTSIEKQPAAADRREEKKNGQRFFDFNRRRR